MLFADDADRAALLDDIERRGVAGIGHERDRVDQAGRHHLGPQLSHGLDGGPADEQREPTRRRRPRNMLPA